MTVHMFRVFIGRGKMSIDDLETRIDDWVQSNAEWTGDSVDHSLTERNTEIDGSGESYHGIDVRFNLDDSKDNLLQKFEDKLENKVEWYRVGYHRCTHDEDDPQPCGWDDTTEWTDKDTSIPSEVPDFDVS